MALSMAVSAGRLRTLSRYPSRNETARATEATSDPRLADLRLTLARLEGVGRSQGEVLPLGELGPHLPAGGLACGVLHEVTSSYADRPAAFGFTFALGSIAQTVRSGPVLFIASRRALRDYGRPYGHGLKQLGLDPGRLLLVETGNDRDCLWTLEEALRTPGLAIVTGAVSANLDLTAARRLNLAAAATATPLALLRLGPEPTGPAATRWRIASAATAQATDAAFSSSRWSVALERCRNGRPASWLIEWTHDTHRFRVVESLADRAALAQPIGDRSAQRRAG